MIALLQTYPFFSDKHIESCTRLKNQGYCNENYLVIADGVKYIVRKLLREDIDRAFEWKVQNLAYKQGITAKPLIFNEEDGVMVFEFLEGEHKSKLDENQLKSLAATLQKLHSISIDVKPIQIHLKNKTEVVLNALETIEKSPKEYVLCHNDLNPQNIFFSEDIKCIDFEYAGVNDRYFDLASVCVEFGLNEQMQEIFLNAYFEGKDFNLQKLEAYKIVYRVLCEEWFIA